MKKVLHSIRSKIQPLLSRRVHTNLQDLCLLFTQSEFKEKHALDLITSLPVMQTKDLMKRWVNYILRSYKEVKDKYDL